MDFVDKTVDDSVVVTIGLSPTRFDKIAELIKAQRVDILEIRLGRVSGFYSEWSPSISTGVIKILTNSRDQEVVRPNGCEIDPPRLGSVGEYRMTIIQRNKLNPKQDLESVINVDKLFEESEDSSLDLEGEQKCKADGEDKDSLILSQLTCNQVALAKLRIPIWLIFIILCFLLLKI